VRVAKDIKTLKKRVRRFFECVPEERRTVSKVLRDLENVADVYVFGGLMRDLTLYGIDDFNSDVDLVVKPYDLVEFKNILEAYGFSQNKFGGYRLQSQRWLFDVWEFKNTWAFQENHVLPHSKRSLIETTFFNWDAILYDCKSNQIICDDKYLDALSHRNLDINLRENPNRIGSLIRALKFIVRDGANTGRDLTRFIVEMLSEMDDYSLLENEHKHSRTPFLHQDILRHLRYRSNQWNDEEFFMWIDENMWTNNDQFELFEQEQEHLKAFVSNY